MSNREKELGKRYKLGDTGSVQVAVNLEARKIISPSKGIKLSNSKKINGHGRGIAPKKSFRKRRQLKPRTRE